jgi:Mg-chelatase subunit ChlD
MQKEFVMHVFARLTRFAICLSVLVAVSRLAAGQEKPPSAAAGPVTYQGLVQLLRSSQSEEEILKGLEQSPLDVGFVLGDSQRAELKKMRVSDEFIEGVQKLLQKRQRVPSTDVTDLVLILDSSGSMLEKTKDGVRKIEAAKQVISELINDFPAGRRLGLIVYGADRSRECQSVEVVRRLGEFDDAARAQLRQYISQLQPSGHTPIARALDAAAGEIEKAKGVSRVVLITDGMETCHGDPAKAAADLAAKTKAVVDVIGFALKPEESRAVNRIAKAGRGKYYDAQTADKLRQRLLEVAKLVPEASPRRDRAEDQLAVLSDHKGSVTSVGILRDGTAVSACGEEKTYWRWDVETGKPRTDNPSVFARDDDLTFSPDGRRVLTKQVGSVVNLTDVETGRNLLRLSVAMHRHGMAFSPNGRRFIIGCQSIQGDPFVGVWDAETGDDVQVFKGHGRRAKVHCVALSADGRFAASADRNDGIRVWDIESGKQLQQLKRRTVLTMAFSPDSKFLVTGESLDVIVVWNATTGEEVRRLEGHSGGVPAISFSPDGRYLVSGGEDKTVRLWDVNTGKELHRFDGHAAEVLSVAFSADGQRAISGGKDKTARVWNIAKYTSPPR